MNQYKFQSVIFAAVSSKQQVGVDEKRFSIPNQIEECRAVITRIGASEVHEPLVVKGHTLEYITLREAERDIPEIAELVTLAEQKTITLVVLYHYNRWRSLIDQIVQTLGVYGCQTYSVTQPVELLPPETFTPYTNDMAAYVVSMSATQSRLQINDLQRKYKIGMPRRVTERGLNFSTIPFGYCKPKVDDVRQLKMATLIQVPEICAGLMDIKDKYLAGASAAEIAAEMNRRGFKPPRGEKWRFNTVLYILSNPFYAGFVHHGTQKAFRDPRTGRARRVKSEPRLVPGKHAALWDEETFYRLRDRRLQVGAHLVGKTRVTHIFSRLVKCRCGKPCHARHYIALDGVYYLCSAPDAPKHARIREEKLFEQVRAELKSLAEKEPPIMPDVSGSDERLLLERQLVELDNKKARFQRAYGDGVIDYNDFTARMTEVDAEKRQREKEIAELNSSAKAVVHRREAQGNIQRFIAAYDSLLSLPTSEANMLMADIVTSIVVDERTVLSVEVR